MRGKVDPTIKDVFEAVQGGFGKVDRRLDKVERRLDGVERRLSTVETRLSGLEDTDRHLIRRVGELESKMDDVQDAVEGLSKAFDHDTIMVIEHDKRIARLEKTRA